MVNADGQAVGRFRAKTQLDPVPGVVGVNAADFNAPCPPRRFEFGSVEVDKKLVRVGNGGRYGANEADFSSHGKELCKFSASMKQAFNVASRTVELGRYVRRYGRVGKDVTLVGLKSLDRAADIQGLATVNGLLAVVL
jgi:hypothetical protein